MKSLSMVLMGFGALIVPLFIMQSSSHHEPTRSAVVDDSLAEARQQHVDEILESIAGSEELPAGEVFENIELFERVPAGRLLRIMDQGFSRSLGVGCDHCHDTEEWPSDDKRPKRAAREMMAMVGTINGELLAGLDNLDPDRPEGSSPTVNCTTCHRGDVTPALDLTE